MNYLTMLKQLEAERRRYEEAVARILGAESRPPLTIQPSHSVPVPIQKAPRVV
jgi:hypothetical protein